MKHYFIPLLILATLFTSGCELNLSSQSSINQTTTALQMSTGSPPSSSDSAHSTPLPSSTSFTTTSLAPENSSPLIPESGILSDPAEYVSGNPKSHSLAPVPRDLSSLPDNTRQEDEWYRAIFHNYLKHYYPEYTFQVVDIENFQSEGKAYKQALAYAAESVDIVMHLRYDGRSVIDSFQSDVVLRQNTMNRWRLSFREYLDPLSESIVPIKLMSLDVSYDHYEENIPTIHLDQAFDPKATRQKRDLNLYIQRDNLPPSEAAPLGAKLLQEVQSLNYAFSNYYLIHQKENGNYVRYLIPLRLLDNQSLSIELEKVLGDSPSDDLIPDIQP